MHQYQCPWGGQCHQYYSVHCTVHNSDRRREARKKIFKSDRSEGAAVTMIGGCTLGIGALPAPVAARRKCTREEARDGGQRPIASTVQKLPTLAMSCWR